MQNQVEQQQVDMKPMLVRTWDDNWNNVIRYLFKDTVLKQLMMIPEKATIIDFRDKYFVLGVAADEILKDENVRIVYWNADQAEIQKNVFEHCLEFSIYVRNSHVYDVDKDRLKRRDIAIAERLEWLLARRRSRVEHMAFRLLGFYDVSTKTIGYKVYHAVFSYYTTH